MSESTIRSAIRESFAGSILGAGDPVAAARVIRSLGLAVSAILGPVYLVLAVLLPVASVRFTLSAVGVALLGGGVYLLARFGRQNAAAVILLSGSWLLNLLAILGAGGLSAPSIVGEMVVVSLATLLFGGYAGGAMLAVGVVGTLGVAWSQTAGVLPRAQVTHTPWSAALVFLAMASLLFVLQIIILRSRARDRHRVAAELAARQLAEQQILLLTDHVYDVIWTFDTDTGRYTYITPSIERMLGFTPDESLAAPAMQQLTAPSREIAEAHVAAALALSARGEDEALPVLNLDLWHKDGSLVSVETITRLLPYAVGKPPLLLGVMRDVTERKRLQDEIERQAVTDELTGVASRRRYVSAAATEVSRSSRYGHPLALVALDLDNLKPINDTYGHLVGDDALRRVASVLQSVVRESDLVARLGGDEFLLLLPDTDFAGAGALVERAAQELAREGILVDGQPITVRFSAGIACLGPDGDTLNAIQSAADDRLYAEKARRRNATAAAPQD